VAAASGANPVRTGEENKENLAPKTNAQIPNAPAANSSIIPPKKEEAKAPIIVAPTHDIVEI
jgi:hypothetical protein